MAKVLQVVVGILLLISGAIFGPFCYALLTAIAITGDDSELKQTGARLIETVRAASEHEKLYLTLDLERPNPDAQACNVDFDKLLDQNTRAALIFDVVTDALKERYIRETEIARRDTIIANHSAYRLAVLDGCTRYTAFASICLREASRIVGPATPYPTPLPANIYREATCTYLKGASGIPSAH